MYHISKNVWRLTLFVRFPQAYTSMLYLEKFKNFKIILRGIPVKQFNIADEFRYPEIIKYRPQIATIEQVI